MRMSPPPDRAPRARGPLLDAELRRMGEERLVSERETTRDIRREFFRASLACVASCVAGLVTMGFGLAAHGRQTGEIFWWGGLVLGYSGISLALASLYRRGQERGYW